MLVTSHAVITVRDQMVTEWANWLEQRGRSGNFTRPLIERQFRLIIDTLTQMLGPLRREVEQVWGSVCEGYGRMGATRGLAAGEVVEELQQLRVLLVRHISATIATMRPRRAISVFLRLNSIIDRGITQAVVGYTDSLVTSLMITPGSDQPDLTAATREDIDRQLRELESELTLVSPRD